VEKIRNKDFFLRKKKRLSLKKSFPTKKMIHFFLKKRKAEKQSKISDEKIINLYQYLEKVSKTFVVFR